MELAEGPTLAEIIARGAMPIEEALPIALQIADAFEYAHERGVVHRDLKPANIKVALEGATSRVKVLDFGLARAFTNLEQPGDDPSNSPTMSMAMTQPGVILGTAGYMAPEQARGKTADRRADVWSFGVVLYEMFTGRRLFTGETVSDVLAGVLTKEPDLGAVPEQVRTVVERCLRKDPRKRWQSIGDVRLALEEGPSVAQTKSPPEPAPRAARLWPAAALVMLAAAAAALAVWAPWRSTTSSGRPVRFEVAETEKMKFFYGDFMAVSPDGHWMVFPATGEDGVNRYWLRSLETVEVRPLPGTETAYVPAAWMADSRHVIFTLLNSNKVYKVDIQGGPPQVLAEIPSGGALNGATANKDGVIVLGVFAPSSLFRVKSESGTVAPVTALAAGETNHRWPQFLPDGHHFLYQRVSSDLSRMGVYVGSLDAKPEEQSLTRLLATNRQAYYAAAVDGGAGRLIFLRDTTLMAQPFDPVKLELSGEPSPIADGIDSFPAATGGLFSVSDAGTLVYRSAAEQRVAPTWFDLQGKPAGTLAEPSDYANAAVSPDGTRIAVARGPAGARDLWVIDVVRSTTMRLTFDRADDDNPVWSPDGSNLAFSSTRTGQPKLYIKPADGSSEERVLIDQPGIPTSWSTDGRILLFTSTSPKTGEDIWALSDPGRAPGERKSFPVLATPSSEFDGQLSPDGRWMAYVSDDASQGGDHVYVQPFFDKEPVAGGRWLVSGGSVASHDGAPTAGSCSIHLSRLFA
jgi:eukaryotic-like serine/threonine-protein kinase